MRIPHALALMLSIVATPLLAEEEDIDPEIEQFFHPAGEFIGDFGGLRSPLKFEDGTEVTTADEWPQRREEIRKAWHGLMGPWPELIEKPQVEYLDNESRDNFIQYHLRIEVAPNRRADDVYLLVPDGDGPFPAVLVVFYDAKSGTGQNERPMCDFAYQLAKRGFVTLSVGGLQKYYPNEKECQLQPLSYLAYQAANCCNLLRHLDHVDPARIGIMGHSYGGKWAMFASCLYDKFACGVWSDGGVVFDEKRANVNYWEPWYLGFEPGQAQRKEGMVTEQNPRTGAYRTMIEAGRNLHELHALMAPRPFLVSGGSEDRPQRWTVLNHAVAVNKLLGFENRVAMTNRADHRPTTVSNEQAYLFFEQFLKKPSPSPAP